MDEGDRSYVVGRGSIGVIGVIGVIDGRFRCLNNVTMQALMPQSNLVPGLLLLSTEEGKQTHS